MYKKIFLVFAVALLVAPIVRGGEFMGLFTKSKEVVYPFSAFEGQLLFQGKPAAEAEITRKYQQLGGKNSEETIKTDEEGRFSFDSIALDFKGPFLAPVEYMSYQDIFVKYKDNEYHIWTASKRSKEEYSEFGGQKPNSIRCEITEEMRGIDISIGLLATNCHWT